MLSRSQELTDALATNVILAREYLKDVVITPDQVGGGVGGWWVLGARRQEPRKGRASREVARSKQTSSCYWQGLMEMRLSALQLLFCLQLQVHAGICWHMH